MYNNYVDQLLYLLVKCIREEPRKEATENLPSSLPKIGNNDA